MKAKLQKILVALLLVLPMGVQATPPEGPFFYGHITDDQGPLAGAMVTLYHGQPVHSLTVFSDEQGRFLSPALSWSEDYSLRVRRVGWKDLRRDKLTAAPAGTELVLKLERETDFAKVAAVMPGNYWMDLVLAEFDDDKLKHEFKQQCTYCHQQGTPLTRVERSREDWQKVILDMGRRGAIITNALRERLPDYFIKAYDKEHALQELARFQSDTGPLPVPSAQARRAVIEEWDLGGTTSNQHDVMIYPKDDSIWTVDGPIDKLHKLELANNPDGDRSSYDVPRGNHKPGGVYWRMQKPPAVGRPETNYLAPHSLQTAPDGRIWLTLPKGNQLAGFDPTTLAWDMVDLEQGINPHTLRFDAKGRLWYTITATNHVGMYNPETREQKFVRLESPDRLTAITIRLTPFFIRNAHWFDLEDRSAKMDGVSMPMPYGIDINPVDGSVWYSQLNYRHIGRIDPDSLKLESIETPFDTPRRLRFDSKGGLWVPSYSEATLNYYQSDSKTWKSWALPIEPLDSATPYALYVDQSTDQVWICGTASDTMLRFDPLTEEFTVYPMPNRVTYTREIDFDADGNMWTSHSNGPAWHIESGIPKVSRIDPDGAPDIDASGLFSTTTAAAN
jgi:virginiamycin B lyase